LPLQALEPVDLDGSGVATLFLLNPTGGVLGGDDLDTAVEIGPGAHVCLSTPSATRVYRSSGAPSTVRTTVRVGKGARLEYVPDHLILSPGARLAQRLDVELARGASAIVSDAWAVGRVARGEAWRFDLLESGIVARDPEGLLFKDRLVLEGTASWGGLGGTEGMAYVATVVCLAPAHPALGDLERAIAGSLTAPTGEATAGVTALARGGVVARILAATAPAMQSLVARAWAACRAELWALPPQLLRKM
jgi:urease accessory protein